jgi:hypothetical protein
MGIEFHFHAHLGLPECFPSIALPSQKEKENIVTNLGVLMLLEASNSGVHSGEAQAEPDYFLK